MKLLILGYALGVATCITVGLVVIYFAQKELEKKEVGELSKCCLAKTELGGMPDFMGDDHVCTTYNICTKCGKPCDTYF